MGEPGLSSGRAVAGLHSRRHFTSPAAMLSSIVLLAGIFYALDPQAQPSPWFHLFSVASIYGAFFIATDPVSASTTPRGRLLYGAGVEC